MARRSRVGAVSLAVAAAGAVATRAALAAPGWGGTEWLQLLAHGFEAGVVGGLADWFAVTALFRHPLGIPIPHTAIIPHRREKIVDSIVTMVETEWLSPEVIGARLERIAPSELLLDWLGSREHVERLAAPARDLLRTLARLLREPELAAFLERLLRDRLADLPSDAVVAEALEGALDSEAVGHALASAAQSMANFAERPSTAETLTWWIERSAEKLHEEGRRLVPFVLRRPGIQRRIVDAACSYASSELRSAAVEEDHPLRRSAKRTIRNFARRLAEGDAATRDQMARLRTALTESLEISQVVQDAVAWTSERLDAELADPDSDLSRFVHRQVVEGLDEALAEPQRRAAFDGWVRSTALDLLRRHHHQIGLTVRENLEALDTGALVEQIETRVGDDLQYVRLNGALVGGLIGLLIALARLLVG